MSERIIIMAFAHSMSCLCSLGFQVTHVTQQKGRKMFTVSALTDPSSSRFERWIMYMDCHNLVGQNYKTTQLWYKDTNAKTRINQSHDNPGLVQRSDTRSYTHEAVWRLA